MFIEFSRLAILVQKIAKRLDLSQEKDQKATDLLSKLLINNAFPLDELKEIIANKPVIVFGAGPSLEYDVLRLQEASLLRQCCLIAANGATTALIKKVKIRPHVITTDLDGKTDDQIFSSQEGSVVVVHAHSDNIPALMSYVPKLHRRVGSTQVEPRPHVYNFGGFTDGDRAAFLAVELGASTLILAGMDFGTLIGEYSKPHPYISDRKMEKLKIGLELLELLSEKTCIPLYNVTMYGTKIKGFKKAKPRELSDLFQNG